MHTRTKTDTQSGLWFHLEWNMAQSRDINVPTQTVNFISGNLTDACTLLTQQQGTSNTHQHTPLTVVSPAKSERKCKKKNTSSSFHAAAVYTMLRVSKWKDCSCAHKIRLAEIVEEHGKMWTWVPSGIKTFYAHSNHWTINFWCYGYNFVQWQ